MAGNNSPSAKRKRGPGKPFAPGVSGNPLGRPKGSAGLAALINAETNGGHELVTFALKVLRGSPLTVTIGEGEDAKIETVVPTVKERLTALDWLGDRGFGKPLQAIELTGADGKAMRVSVTDLTDEELEVFERVGARASTEPPEPEGDSGGEGPTPAE